jgi:transposase
MQVLDGNQNDTQTMQTSVQTHIEQLRQVGIGVLVKDSAGYSEAALQAHEEAELKWIMRVPAKLKDVKTLLETTTLSSLQPLTEGYRYRSVTRHYAGLEQRWLVIHSRTAETRARKTMGKQVLKQTETEQKAFAKLCRHSFACQADAEAALKAFQAKLQVLTVQQPELRQKRHYATLGRPAKDQPADSVSYQLHAYLAAPITCFQEQVTRAALFLLASNELDPEQLSDQEILLTYKAQSRPERGFRFLKDPMFLASTLFLKKVERIMALLMVMTLCLLVYAALEHRIRLALAEKQQSLPDQKGKPTATPTARWVFELFLDVHLLTIIQDRSTTITMNLKDDLRILLKLLGPLYDKAYPYQKVYP